MRAFPLPIHLIRSVANPIERTKKKKNKSYQAVAPCNDGNKWKNILIAFCSCKKMLFFFSSTLCCATIYNIRIVVLS